MNMTTANRWGWLGLLWLVCACGGQVTDEGGEQGGDDRQGEASGRDERRKRRGRAGWRSRGGSVKKNYPDSG